MTPECARLVERLRNPPPDRPEWDFASVRHCALYDCHELDIRWGELGIPNAELDDILGVYDTRRYGNVDRRCVTPEMVATALEAASS